MKYSSVLILLLIVFSGCTKELKVDFGEPSKKIVLYPIVTNNKKIVVKMSGAAGILSNSFPVLDDPTVVITDNNTPVDTVTIDKQGNGYSKIIPFKGHEYGFTASATGYPNAITATRLPDPVLDLQTDTTYQYFDRYDKLLKVRIRIKDDPDQINYYKVTLNLKQYRTISVLRRIGGILVAYDSSYIHIGRPNQLYANLPDLDFFRHLWRNQYLLAQDVLTFNDESPIRTSLGSEVFIVGSEFYFSDNVFNGKEKIFELLPRSDIKSYYPEKYLIELSSVSEESYMGVKSFARYGTKEKANLPVSEEVSIYSAVKGGYGFPITTTTVIDSSFSKPRY
jgi:hypothetical protein